MDKFKVAGQALVGQYNGQPVLIQCDADGRVLTSSEDSPVSILGVITSSPAPTATYTPPAGAKFIMINSAPTNTANVKYGTQAAGRRLYLQPGQTIQLPATVLSLESVTGTQELGIMAYG